MAITTLGILVFTLSRKGTCTVIDENFKVQKWKGTLEQKANILTAKNVYNSVYNQSPDIHQSQKQILVVIIFRRPEKKE